MSAWRPNKNQWTVIWITFAVFAWATLGEGDWQGVFDNVAGRGKMDAENAKWVVLMAGALAAWYLE